jgi:choline dehydrogenase-like flavoprotein
VKTIPTDVLVIGTGFGAAAPALRLAQAGAKVIMLEKGPRVQTADFRQTSDPKYILKYLKGTPGDNLQLTYAEALGGGSAFYEMVSLRAPTPAFEQRAASA